MHEESASACTSKRYRLPPQRMLNMCRRLENLHGCRLKRKMLRPQAPGTVSLHAMMLRQGLLPRLPFAHRYSQLRCETMQTGCQLCALIINSCPTQLTKSLSKQKDYLFAMCSSATNSSPVAIAEFIASIKDG